MEVTAAERNALRAVLEKRRGKMMATAAPPSGNNIASTSVAPPKVHPIQKVQAKPRKINNEYDDLEGVTVFLTSAPKPWKDSDIKSIKITEVNRLSPVNIISVGREMLSSIQLGKVTSSVVDQILSTAVSLLSPNISIDRHKYILESLPADIGSKIRTADIVLTSPAETEVSKVAEKLERTRRNIEKATDEDKKRKLQALETKLMQQMNEVEADGLDADQIVELDDAYAYAYLAAYIMRLAGKTAEVWVDKLEVAKTRFNTWYDCESSILDDVHITSDQAEKIREGLARRSDSVATWILWVAYNENENSSLEASESGMLRYIATQMYSYTGMHAYVSIMLLSREHNLSFKFLLSELSCPATRKAVDEVETIIRHHEVTEAHPTRKTYFRYARVWDSGYFVNLQSKNCIILGYTVSKARKMLSASSAVSDPTQAFAFKNMGAKLKATLDVVAGRLYELIMARAKKGYMMNQGPSEMGENKLFY